MRLSLPDRVLQREIGLNSTYPAIPGMYGDREFIDNLDIVNELEGHSGCVNALRYNSLENILNEMLTTFEAGLVQDDYLLLAQMIKWSTSIRTSQTMVHHNLSFVPVSKLLTLQTYFQ